MPLTFLVKGPILKTQAQNAMTLDPNDKYAEYSTDFSANEEPTEDSAYRHRDQYLEVFCDTHPSAPQCKVFDD
tara:strand:- start:890 stop:1108 length:219 start_codon:yes stop_codon:yes gene_type:complete